jgi:hypothetical protein
MLQKLKNNLPAAIIIAAFVIGGALVYSDLYEKEEGEQKNLLSAQAAAEKAVGFINANLLGEGSEASVKEVSDENGLYKFVLVIGESEFTSYVTKDGNFLFPDPPISMEEEAEEAPVEDAVKSEVPDVKLFVMSYCPYGLQAEKGFLPVYDLLKEKADMGLYFVDYIMHGKKEIDENLTQYCIQKEEESKFSSYLSCFVLSGSSEDCLQSAQIDKAKIASCVASADQEFGITEKYNDQSTWRQGTYPLFGIHSALNQQYSVQGSPTLVINGKAVSVNRDAESIKKAVCSAFSEPPSECDQVLSSAVPTAGFGGGESDSSSGGCG